MNASETSVSQLNHHFLRTLNQKEVYSLMSSLTAILSSPVLSFEFPFIVIVLLLARFTKIDPLRYSGILVILTAAKMVIAHLSGNDFILVPILVSSLVSMLVIVLVAGLLGTRMGTDNYKSLLGGSVMFPWYLGMDYSLVYIFVSLAVLSVVSLWKTYSGFWSNGHRMMKKDRAKKELPEDEYNNVIKKASTIFALPLIVSSFLVIAILSL